MLPHCYYYCSLRFHPQRLFLFSREHLIRPPTYKILQGEFSERAEIVIHTANVDRCIVPVAIYR